jgi:hypothetical protein
MKTKYFYIKDSEGKPRITRCIVQDENGNVGVGTAICSYLDSPNKKTGRTIAYGRALKALAHNKSYAPIARDKARNIIQETLHRMGEFISTEFKGLFVPHHQYGAYLSEFEKKILGV